MVRETRTIGKAFKVCPSYRKARGQRPALKSANRLDNEGYSKKHFTVIKEHLGRNNAMTKSVFM